jgi:septal ring factor EnvC (AmiA/AmiB activator)
LKFLNNRQSIRNADEADIRDHYAEEVGELRKELKQCEEECRAKLDAADVKLDAAQKKIKELDQELWGEKRQRVAEQISLINVIISSVDAPELKAILKTLESVQMAQRIEHQIDNAP